MLHKVYDIELPYEELGLKTPEKKATITTYIKEMYPDYQDPFNRPLVIICPGGGYDHHSPREGEAVAVKMLELGYNAVVLRYSLAPYIYPTQVYEAAYTVKWVRDHAKEWDVNPDRIILAGFSAGGHLAACLGTMWSGDMVASFAKKYLGHKNDKKLCFEIIRAALSSCADTAIIPMQDYLELDSSARINTPSTLGCNWKWRMDKNALDPKLAKKIYKMAKLYGRL